MVENSDKNPNQELEKNKIDNNNLPSYEKIDLEITPNPFNQFYRKPSAPPMSPLNFNITESVINLNREGTLNLYPVLPASHNQAEI